MDKITYKKGSFKNAMNVQSGRVNESNDLLLIRTDEPKDAILVRQISGAIARRIVCDLRPGQVVARGHKFGMIKFGSRVDLILPPSATIVVEHSQKTRAGETILARY